ncbi:hypothetical protein [Candidatus Bodocaedibacter vickermanii]|uniref:Uncharacterized protein n=1 Tax=Candidatus Bodocaedibacter vickermanii TaxID=2741701 RepID=A0A7L9RUV2_9PROT|nr:hypothetical protein CPBP_01078 [Candidatus Paracaedibacteraceae bacterium 'Lake Konstanz']
MNRLIFKVVLLVFCMNPISSSCSNPFNAVFDAGNECILNGINSNEGCCSIYKAVFVLAPPLCTTLSSATDISLTSFALYLWDSDHHKRDQLLTTTCWCAFLSYLAHSISHYDLSAEIYKEVGSINNDVNPIKQKIVQLTGRTFLTIILFADVFASMAGDSLLNVIEKECEIVSLICSCAVFVYSACHLMHAIQHLGCHHADADAHTADAHTADAHTASAHLLEPPKTN